MGTTTTKRDTIPAVQLFPNLPSIIAVEVKFEGMAGFGTIKMPLAVVESSGNPFYKGGARRGVKLPTVSTDEEIAALATMPDGERLALIRKVLATMEVRHVDGTPFVTGEVHVSKPRLNKAGEEYGGGNLTVQATSSILVPNGNEVRGYTAKVFATWLGLKQDGKGRPKLFSLTGQLTNQPEPSDPLTGEMDGFDTTF